MMIISFQWMRLSTITMLVILPIFNLRAHDEVVFDKDFMHSLGTDAHDPEIDLDAIVRENQVSAGRYPVNIILNGESFGLRNVFLEKKSDILHTCIPQSLLTEMGVSINALPVEMQSLDCIDLLTSIPQAQAVFDQKKLTLTLSVPQVAMEQSTRGYVAPQKWDEGINAGILNYQFATGHTQSSGAASHDIWNLYLNGRLNIGQWRLHSAGSIQQKDKWQSRNIYIERDLPGTLGTMVLGDSFTQGDVLESIPMRGVQVGTNVDMIPDSMQGYAPVIRGVAQSQARVEVRQHGYSLYTTYVAPGPFQISDLNTTSGSGDLEVIITEADGRESRFTQPYATLGNLLRQGTWRYNVAAGEYKTSNSFNNDKPKFTTASAAYGLPKDYTATFGTTMSKDYKMLQIGVGKALGHWGAASLNVSQAKSTLAGKAQQGQSYSLSYGKAFSSGTNLRFSGYRYSTKGYRTLTEVVTQNSNDEVNSYASNYNRRSRFEFNLTQNIGSTSSIYLTLNQQNYWNSSYKERQLQFGHNMMIGNVNVNLYASKNLSNSRDGTQISVALSLPFGRHSINTSIDRGSDRRYSERVGISGTQGDRSQYNYNIDAFHTSQQSDQLSASLGYRAPWAQLNSGMLLSSNMKSVNFSATGAVLAHSGGLEMTQNLGETVGIVQVKDTPNVEVKNAPGNFTNAKGYTVIPYLRPYRNNRISLDTSYMDNDTEIEGGAVKIAPRKGAIVAARFNATKSNTVLLQLQSSSGEYLPFGAAILDPKGQQIGIVGQAGQALVRLDEKSTLNIKWGDKGDQSCSTSIDAKKALEIDGLKVVNAVCNVNL